MLKDLLLELFTVLKCGLRPPSDVEFTVGTLSMVCIGNMSRTALGGFVTEASVEGTRDDYKSELSIHMWERWKKTTRPLDFLEGWPGSPVSEDSVVRLELEVVVVTLA